MENVVNEIYALTYRYILILIWLFFAGCKCYSKGSEIPTCDIVTGQCRCRSNYVGLQCDNCKVGM